MADVLVDAGPLLAVVNKNDQNHAVCTQIILNLEPPLLTTLPVLTEALYLCHRRVGWIAQERLLETINEGAIRVLQTAQDDFLQIAKLMSRYNDLPMDFADASLVVVAERLSIAKIFTTDRRDFSLYRFGKNQRFDILGP